MPLSPLAAEQEAEYAGNPNVDATCGSQPKQPKPFGKAYPGARKYWPFPPFRTSEYSSWKREMKSYDRGYAKWLRCAKVAARTAPGATTPGADIVESLEDPLTEALGFLGGFMPGGAGWPGGDGPDDATLDALIALLSGKKEEEVVVEEEADYTIPIIVGTLATLGVLGAGAAIAYSG